MEGGVSKVDERQSTRLIPPLPSPPPPPLPSPSIPEIERQIQEIQAKRKKTEVEEEVASDKVCKAACMGHTYCNFNSYCGVHQLE